jgi:hypothetical protein
MMPLKLNIGSSKKIGEPNYGSKGASVNLELELDSSLLQSPGQLQGQIQSLFQQARDAVEAELFGRESTPGMTQNGHGQNGSSTNGNGQYRSSNGRRATNSQVKAIYAISKGQQIDLPSLLRQQYHVDRPEELSLKEASRLIDELKAEPVSNGGRQ